jgi:threonine aldolase
VKVLDLRSDTVTRPTPAMREAMARAEVGDDVYGEDPTVNRLQAECARRTGKEAALFVPSGTMGNQLAVRLHTRHGDVVLAGEATHLLDWESGGAAALSGVQIRCLGRGGSFDGADVRAAIPPVDPHCAPASLVCLENTHNLAGGRIFPLAQVRDVADAARERGLRLHLDGARLWNAVVASGTDAATWCAPFDTVTFCLSKGLGAPVGSVLCGDAASIERALRFRKMLGGGMRQAGILAAAGLHALEHHVARLADDHANARRLADGLAALGLAPDPAPETNLVYFRAPWPGALLRALRARDVWIDGPYDGRLRAVTHLDISKDDVEDALGRTAEALRDVPDRKETPT